MVGRGVGKKIMTEKVALEGEDEIGRSGVGCSACNHTGDSISNEGLCIFGDEGRLRLLIMK